ncbi:RrF2 family transcriptional regulator [Kaistella jeonii]|uniref:Rrf2 family transcriptional regulator n=1 Tax=Kaistella jeonii TaxID=266749 RepID=A0A0C1F6E9_9FLAO|nr:Rrf2 family transcriptional regulator [Kaistella jeonii]KIA88762.1 Rrf2 family transcriptional regulator [Kaistella jeonii]SFC40592.1 Rrf2 family protein [Kaistella jeonii]VEI97385.1 HTH-type transcriptional repressor NsrR [Kaistella jeonii]
MFSKACEYAIKATIYIAQQSHQEKRTNVKEVAKSINAPEAFTAKILQQLCRENILESIRGKQGGFTFDVTKQRITKIYDVVCIIDGESIFTNCGLGLHKCSSDNPCPVHDDFKIVRENLIAMTQKYSFYDLAVKTENGLAWLK